MKGLYIIGVDVERFPQYKGVRKKIRGQIKAYKQLKVDIDYIDVYNDKIYFNNIETNYILEKNNEFIKNNEFYYKIIKNKITMLDNYDFVYIRFSMSNIGCYLLVRYLYKLGVKVIIEIPTYPYIEEIKLNLKNRIRVIIDKLLWKMYKKYIYRISVTTDLHELYGIKTIPIFNGVDLDENKISNNTYDKNNLNIVGVANISKWHGYDRVINGIYDYYNDIKKKSKLNVHFYIVGEGDEKENLKEITETLGLNDKIIFTGLKYGKELDEIYSKSNIGVSSLALHRAGGGHDPIKAKECIAKGLPVIISQKDRALHDKLDFVFEIPNDDSPVNINTIIDLYRKMETSKIKIREYAEKNLSWKSQMKKIIDSINVK